VLHVEENVIELKGGELKRKAPKSDYRLRTVPLPEFVVTALKEYRRRQIERVHGGNVLDNGLGGCIKPQRLSDDFHKAAKAAGVKVTLHGMRHQFASIVAASGADFKRLQTLMGHSESRTTFEFYVHLRPDDYRESAALMDEQLGDLMQAAK
jgi:integrase